MLTRLDPCAQYARRVLKVLALVHEAHLDSGVVGDECACGREAGKAAAENANSDGRRGRSSTWDEG